jgi:hypothetical protein
MNLQIVYLNTDINKEINVGYSMMQHLQRLFKDESYVRISANVLMVIWERSVRKQTWHAVMYYSGTCLRDWRKLLKFSLRLFDVEPSHKCVLKLYLMGTKILISSTLICINRSFRYKYYYKLYAKLWSLLLWDSQHKMTTVIHMLRLMIWKV